MPGHSRISFLFPVLLVYQAPEIDQGSGVVRDFWLVRPDLRSISLETRRVWMIDWFPYQARPDHKMGTSWSRAREVRLRKKFKTEKKRARNQITMYLSRVFFQNKIQATTKRKKKRMNKRMKG